MVPYNYELFVLEYMVPYNYKSFVLDRIHGTI